MKPVLEEWSLVILGKWNSAILSPKWVSDEIFSVPSIEVFFPVLGGLPPKYKSGEIELTVSGDRIVFAPLKNDDDFLQKVEDSAKKILNILVHTPVSAFGENFHFELSETEAPDILKDTFDLKDIEILSSSGKINRVAIERSIERDNHILNFKVENGNISGIYNLNFNYHYSVITAKIAEELINATLINNKQHTLNLLRDIYSIKIEEEDQDVQ